MATGITKEHMGINELAMLINATAHEKGWYDGPDGLPVERNFGEVIALMHSELSEALEAWRDGKDFIYYGRGKPEGWAVELADCVIRIFDTLYEQGVNIESLMLAKMAYNRERPYRHGGKKA